MWFLRFLKYLVDVIFTAIVMGIALAFALAWLIREGILDMRG